MYAITSLITAILGIVTILGILGMGVNAFKLLRSFKNGVLAKGWKYISIAAFFFIFGIVALDLSVSTWLPSSVFTSILGYTGAALQAIGGLTFAFGCKAQYDAWNPKEMKKTVAKSTEESLTLQQ